MKALFISLLGSLLLISILQAQTAKAPDEWKVPVAHAHSFLQLLQQSQYDSALTYFDATMKSALPAKKLENMWKTLQEQMGAFQEQGAVRTEKVQGYHVVYVTCVFKEGKLDAKMVFDSKNKIAGLFFVPHQESGSYKMPSYVNPRAFTEIDTLKLPNKWHLPATLSLPNGAGPFPAVILLHGSGPGDRDETIGPNKPFKDLALGLASRGIAVLRFDKRTYVFPNIVRLLKGKFTVQDETIDDALTAARFLKEFKKVDPDRVFLLGHSLGGYLIPRIARQCPCAAGFIIMAGAARPLPVLIREQYRTIFSLDGKIDRTERRKLREIDSLTALVQSPKYWNNTDPLAMVLGAPPAYWKDLAQYDLQKAAGCLHKPVLVLQGGKDYQVTKKDFVLWKRYLKNDSQSRFVFYPDLNHLFMKVPGIPSPAMYEIRGHVALRVIKDIAQWIKETSARK